MCDFEGENPLENWTTNINPNGGSVTVETDSISGSKALKIVHPWLEGVTSGDTATYARYDLYNDATVNSGVVKV